MLIRRVSHEAHIWSPGWHSAWRIAWLNGQNREWCHSPAWKIISAREPAVGNTSGRSVVRGQVKLCWIPNSSIRACFAHYWKSFPLDSKRSTYSSMYFHLESCAEEVGTGPGPKHSVLFQNCSSGFWTRNRFHFINFLCRFDEAHRSRREGGKEPIGEQKKRIRWSERSRRIQMTPTKSIFFPKSFRISRPHETEAAKRTKEKQKQR